MGLPGYRLQAKSVLFEDNPVPVIDPFTGQPQINPATNEPLLQHDRMVTSRNNVIYLENVPVFYWPVMKNDVEQSSFYIRQARFKSDRIFGEQILVDWDAYQILGLKHCPAPIGRSAPITSRPAAPPWARRTNGRAPSCLACKGRTTGLSTLGVFTTTGWTPWAAIA